MPADASTAVAVIGLGAMGYGVAASLLRAGIRTRGCDLNPEVRDRFAGDGGAAHESAAAAADGADAIVVMVVNATQAEAVLFGPDGALTSGGAGKTVLQCATVPPAAAEDFAARVEAAGALMLDAPVSGGAAAAADGALTVMASGPPAAFERAAPVLDAIAAKVYRLGDACGAGSTVKMINQLLAGVHIAAAAEAMAFGTRAGADPRTLFEVIANSAGSSWMFRNRVPHMLDGDFTPRSAVEIFVKDLGIVLDTGRAARFPLPLAAAAHQQFLAAAGAGWGGLDDAAVVKVYEALSGVAVADDAGEGGG